MDPDTPIDAIKSRYRRLSILVHPDKNQDDAERAQAAFDAVKKAYAMLEDETTRKKCEEIIDEAKGRTQLNMEEKRKQLKKQGKDTRVEEDDPIAFKSAVHVLSMKLFADLERKRRANEQKISDEAAKKRQMELATQEQKTLEKEFAKNFEESRQGRVDSWLSFKTGKTAKAKKEKPRFSPMGFKPPKTKPESR